MKKKIYPKMSNVAQNWARILQPFTKDYSARLSASDIAKMTGMPRQTVCRQLDVLASQNLLSYARSGKNKLYYFDLDKQTTKTLLNLIENEKALGFLLKNKAAAVVIGDILKCCETVILFGSYASGTFDDDSDLDLVILGNIDKSGISKVKARSPIEVNEHQVSYIEYSRLLMRRQALAIEIQKNHVLFGDVSRIIDIFWRKEYGRR